MELAGERLQVRLRETALTVLRRHGFGEDDLRLENGEAGKPPQCLILAHRIRVHVDESSATLKALAGKWSGQRADFPTAGAFVAAFETALHDALSGN